MAAPGLPNWSDFTRTYSFTRRAAICDVDRRLEHTWLASHLAALNNLAFGLDSQNACLAVSAQPEIHIWTANPTTKVAHKVIIPDWNISFYWTNPRISRDHVSSKPLLLAESKPEPLNRKILRRKFFNEYQTQVWSQATHHLADQIPGATMVAILLVGKHWGWVRFMRTHETPIRESLQGVERYLNEHDIVTKMMRLRGPFDIEDSQAEWRNIRNILSDEVERTQ